MIKPLKFKNLSNAWNYLRNLKKTVKKAKEMKGGSQDLLGVTAGGKTNAERLKFLSYCISLLSGDDYPHYTQKEFHVNILTAMCKGYSKEYIASQSGCSLKTLEMHETEAINRVQDAIERTKKRNIPIFKEEMEIPLIGTRH